MRDLLITETNHPEMRNIFFVERNSSVKKMLEFLPPYELPLSCLNMNRKLDCLQGLPGEMVQKILKITIDWQLENNNFAKAYSLMCSCRAIFFFYFDRIVGRQGLMGLDDRARLLRGSLKLAEKLTALYTEQTRFMPTPNIFTVNLHIDTYFFRNFNVISVKSLSYSYQDIVHPLRNCEYKKIHTGVRPCDNVWLFGKQGKQFFHCIRMYRPALVFMLEKRYKHTNGYFLTDPYFPDFTDFNQIRPLELFGDLMRKAFGPETGVFFINATSPGDFEKFLIREV